ncbi:MAG: hypothetical protein KDC13_07110, partial [Bacteroidetes bacterium]|nr:hypothetical protein [Bacteroidota bacterium]
VLCFAGEGDSTGTGSKKWLSLSAGLTMSAQFYQNWGGTPRQQPFMYSLSGAPALDIKGVTMPFSVIYSNQVFSYQQPFNQFGLAPRFKFGTVYLGTASIRQSNYTLAGQRFTGVGAELQFKWLRLGGMYGRLRKQVVPFGNFNDPTTFLNESETPSFKRNGYTVKIGFGKKEHFFDLIWFKGYDVVPDDFDQADWNVRPRENVVFGINSSLNFGKKVTLKNDWGISAFTQNTLADTVEIENQQLRQLARGILLPRISTQIRIAGESSIRFNHKVLSPSFSYKRVELDYTSLGAYFFQTDLQQFTGGINLKLFKGKLITNASLGRQNDNLQKQRLRTSYRSIGSVNINYNPSPRWGMNLIYSNFGITQSPLPKSLTDTTRINQVNNSFTFMPRLLIQKGKSTHSMHLSLGYTALNNLGASIAATAAMTNYTGNFNYTWQHTPTMLSLGLTPTAIISRTFAGEFFSRGATFNAGKVLGKGKFNVNYVGGYFSNDFNGVSNGYTVTQLLSFTGNIPKWPSLTFNIQHINNVSNNTLAVQSFKELFATISVSYNF